jgi:type II restriction enzyme
VDQYRNLNFPRERVFIVGLKTTCKDRWRQILNEGPLVEQKYLLTVQPGISAPQVHEMVQAKGALIVPEPLHQHYPTEVRPLLSSVEEFFERVQRAQR